MFIPFNFRNENFVMQRKNISVQSTVTLELKKKINKYIGVYSCFTQRQFLLSEEKLPEWGKYAWFLVIFILLTSLHLAWQLI